MELPGKKIVVLAEDLRDGHDLGNPCCRLEEAGAEFTLAGTDSGTTCS